MTGDSSRRRESALTKDAIFTPRTTCRCAAPGVSSAILLEARAGRRPISIAARRLDGLPAVLA